MTEKKMNEWFVVEKRRKDDYQIVKPNGVVITFPRPTPYFISSHSVEHQRLYAKQHGLKVWDRDEICRARGEPTAEELKAKRLEEARAHKRHLGLDPSEADVDVEHGVKIEWLINYNRGPYPYSTLAKYTGNKTGRKQKCLIFKHPRQDPNLSAASVATTSGKKEAEVGGRSLLKCPHADIDKSSETSVENAKPETDSSATLVTSGNKEAEVGGRSLLKRPHVDIDKSSETSVENAKPETDSSATLVASGDKDVEVGSRNLLKRPRLASQVKLLLRKPNPKQIHQ